MSDKEKLKRRLPPEIRAARYAFALAIVLCLALGLYLTIEDDSATKTKLSGLG